MTFRGWTVTRFSPPSPPVDYRIPIALAWSTTPLSENYPYAPCTRVGIRDVLTTGEIVLEAFLPRTQFRAFCVARFVKSCYYVGVVARF